MSSPVPPLRSRLHRSGERPLCEAYDLVIVDLDGTVYVGDRAIPAAVDALAELRGRRTRAAFVTNNASRTPEDVAVQLSALGVEAGPLDVVTSAQAAARLLAGMLPAGSRVLVVGGRGLREALADVGLVPVAAAGDSPLAVVQGWTADLGWGLLAEGAYALARGLPWVATNTDRTLPTAQGLAPGNGAFVSLLAEVTGRQPDVVAGKPGVALLRQTAERFSALAPLVVGDRLDTDIEGAVCAGMDSLLVLTGVSGVEDLLSAGPDSRPTFVATDLGGVLESYPEVVARPGEYRVRDATVTSVAQGPGRPTALEVGAEPAAADRSPRFHVDLVRAAAAAAWAAQDAGIVAEPTPRLLELLRTFGRSGEERP